jgi:hypothetical protein
MNKSWSPLAGTYRIGQVSAHNGTAIFQLSGVWISGAIKNVTISGDGGDRKMHFKLAGSTNGSVVDGAGSSRLRVSYVDCGTRMDGFQFNGVSEIEVDHCRLVKLAEAAGGDDHICYISNKVAAWDDSTFHDNRFYIPRDEAGSGDDCIQGASDGFSFYHNRVVGYTTNYTGGQHQDGIQPLGGSYVKCYDNYFQNIANYAVFGDAYYGDFAHFWVYNNIIVITDAKIRSSDPPQGIAIGPDGGSESQMGRWPTFTDVVVANNLIADYGNHGSINLRNNPGQASTFDGCVVKNNIVINSGGIGVDPAVQTAADVVTTLSSGTGQFVQYTPQRAAPPNNFHLSLDDTLFRGKGNDLSAYFKTDRDGVSRAGAWDIGPYKWISP